MPSSLDTSDENISDEDTSDENTSNESMSNEDTDDGNISQKDFSNDTTNELSSWVMALYFAIPTSRNCQRFVCSEILRFVSKCNCASG